MRRETKRRLLIVTGCLCLFGGGFITAVNLPWTSVTTPAHEAAWWKAAIAGIVSLCWMEYLWRGQ